jgi:hypothetical protein
MANVHKNYDYLPIINHKPERLAFTYKTTDKCSCRTVSPNRKTCCTTELKPGLLFFEKIK